MIDYNAIDWKEFFYYDETSPSGIRWKVDRLAGRDGKTIVKRQGDVAGSLALNPDGSNKCWDVRLDYKLYKAHRIVWILHNAVIDNELVVDHIDGNPSNNLIINLRVIEKSRNHRNSKKCSRNKTGETGVHWQYMNKGKHLYAVGNVTLDGQQYSARFGTHHFDDAFERAVAWRKKTIADLNLRGADFTDRHGT